MERKLKNLWFLFLKVPLVTIVVTCVLLPIVSNAADFPIPEDAVRKAVTKRFEKDHRTLNVKTLTITDHSKHSKRNPKFLIEIETEANEQELAKRLKRTQSAGEYDNKEQFLFDINNEVEYAQTISKSKQYWVALFYLREDGAFNLIGMEERVCNRGLWKKKQAFKCVPSKKEAFEALDAQLRKISSGAVFVKKIRAYEVKPISTFRAEAELKLTLSLDPDKQDLIPPMLTNIRRFSAALSRRPMKFVRLYNNEWQIDLPKQDDLHRPLHMTFK